uniref:Alpha-carbonic anhydrase domain-containing protein n=1 Tax=Periophthalmus magnuspinnatus TaxID=409849 RepID=A0A3B3ZDC5_9GOBI
VCSISGSFLVIMSMIANWCDAVWGSLAPKHCAGSRQSPIDIVSEKATYDRRLTAFTFNNFSSKTALSKIENTGNTVKVTLASGVSVSGGGLSEQYEGVQFHLHWGNGSSVPGSEHTVNSKRYAMEVSVHTTDWAYDNTTGEPAAWKTLTSYLSKITEKGQSAPLSESLSLDDLLPGVDRTKYYRYLGSLTTPNCDEAVVWTVFKDPVKVSKDLIDLFAKTVRTGNSTSPHMVNVYRGIQPKQPVTHSSCPKTSASSGLLFFALALWMSSCFHKV